MLNKNILIVLLLNSCGFSAMSMNNNLTITFSSQEWDKDNVQTKNFKEITNISIKNKFIPLKINGFSDKKNLEAFGADNLLKTTIKHKDSANIISREEGYKNKKISGKIMTINEIPLVSDDPWEFSLHHPTFTLDSKQLINKKEIIVKTFSPCKKEVFLIDHKTLAIKLFEQTDNERAQYERFAQPNAKFSDLIFE